MSTTTATTLTCARCGTVATSPRAFCTSCGAPLQAPAPVLQPSSAPRPAPAALARAQPLAVIVGVGIDVALVVLLLLVTVLLVLSPVPAFGVFVALVTVVAAVFVPVRVLATGRGPGWTVTGVRLLTVADSAPLGWGRLLNPQRMWLADTRRGRGDPLAVAGVASVDAVAPWRHRAPTSRPTSLPDSPTSAEDDAHVGTSTTVVSLEEDERTSYRSPLVSRAGLLVVDENARYPVAPSMVVGRNPDIAPGQVPVVVTDFERSISKTHLLIERESDGALFVTDLASTNGTFLQAPDSAPRRLVAQVRTPLPDDTLVQVGEHTLRLDRAAGPNNHEALR